MYRFLKGQGLVEYALILALIAIGSFITLDVTGYSVRDVYCAVAEGFGAADACAGERVYCGDDFANLDNWESNWGTWTADEGKICTSGYSKNYNTCSQSMENMSDYVIHLDGAKLNAGDGYGVFFRGTELDGKTNGYIVQYDPGLGAVVIRKWINGAELAPFATKKMPGYDWYGETHDLKIDVKGDTFTVYLDDEEILVTQDDTYPEGGVGLRSWDSTNLCIDSLNIGELSLNTGEE